MLTSPERLRKPNLFQRVYSARKSVSCDQLTLYVLARQARSAPRLPLAGFVIGKKVHSKSTDRNRSKRRVREAYRLLRQQLQEMPEQAEGLRRLNLEQWYAIVWVIQGDLLEKSWAEVSENVVNCLRKASEKHGIKRVSR